MTRRMQLKRKASVTVIVKHLMSAAIGLVQFRVLFFEMKLQTALLASSICDVLATHSCSCYCRPARHPCLKDSLSLSKISLFLESVWSHPSGAKGQKLAVHLGPVGMNGVPRERAMLGKSRVQIIWTSCTFYTTASWKSSLWVLSWNTGGVGFLLCCFPVPTPVTALLLTKWFPIEQNLCLFSWSSSSYCQQPTLTLLEIFQKNTYWMRDTFNLYWITSISK